MLAIKSGKKAGDFVSYYIWTMLQMNHAVTRTWHDGMYHFLLSISPSDESGSFSASGESKLQ